MFWEINNKNVTKIVIPHCVCILYFREIVGNNTSKEMTSQMNLIDVGDGPPIFAASDNNQEVPSMGSINPSCFGKFLTSHI